MIHYAAANVLIDPTIHVPVGNTSTVLSVLCTLSYGTPTVPRSRFYCVRSPEEEKLSHVETIKQEFLCRSF